jgi:hypothetical protein
MGHEYCGKSAELIKKLIELYQKLYKNKFEKWPKY